MNQADLKKEIDPAVDAFMGLGFPRYESLVLAILTAIGTATVKEIHSYTDVPLPKVYQTLDSLTRKSLIKQHTKTRPVQYTAYSPKIIMRRIQEENRTSEQKLNDELVRISDLSEPSFTGEIAPFSGKDAFLRVCRGVILNAEKQLSVSMSTETLNLFSEELAIAKEKGVVLKSQIFEKFDQLNKSLKPDNYKKLGFEHHIIEIGIKTAPSLKFLNILKKLLGIIDYLGIIISDNNESVIILPLFPHETYFGIWVSSKAIVQKQQEGYDELAKIASKV